MICVKPNKGCPWTPDLVEASASSNRDGFGLMYVDNDPETKQAEVMVVKSMGGPGEVAKIFEQYMDRPLAYHVRIATHGEKNLENCHPYMVTSKKEGHPRTIYMMHNGMIRDVQLDNKMSDSWNFATHFLRPILAENPDLLDSEGFNHFLAAMIGHNKLVFLDDREVFTVINDDLGKMQNGCWISAKTDVTTWKSRAPFNPQNFPHRTGNFGAAVNDRSSIAPHNRGEWKPDSDDRLHFVVNQSSKSRSTGPSSESSGGSEDDDKEGHTQEGIFRGGAKIIQFNPPKNEVKSRSTKITEGPTERGNIVKGTNRQPVYSGDSTGRATDSYPWGSFIIEPDTVSEMGKEEILQLVLENPREVTDYLHKISRDYVALREKWVASSVEK